MKKDKTKNSLQFQNKGVLQEKPKGANTSGQLGPKQGVAKKQKYYSHAKHDIFNNEQPKNQDFTSNGEQGENKVFEVLPENAERSEASPASEQVQSTPQKKYRFDKRHYYKDNFGKPTEQQAQPTTADEQPKSGLQHEDKGVTFPTDENAPTSSTSDISGVPDTSGIDNTSGHVGPKLQHEKKTDIPDSPKKYKQGKKSKAVTDKKSPLRFEAEPKNEAPPQPDGADLKTATPSKSKKQRYYKKSQKLKGDSEQGNKPIPKEEKSRLRFEDDTIEPNGDTSGHVEPKPKTDSKFHTDGEHSRPSERLTHDDEAPKAGKLNPSKKEKRFEKKLEKSKLKADKSGVKLEKAKNKLAKQKPLKRPGAAKTLGIAAKHEAWRFIHGKIYEVEHENVGIEAAHRTELAGEKVVGGTVRFVKKQIRQHPTRKVRKWSKRTMKANANHSYNKFIQENPQKHSNPISRYWQKKQYKKKYIKQSKKAAKVSTKAAKKTATGIKRVTSAILNFVKTNPKAILIILCAFLLIVIINSLMASISTIGNGIIGSVGGTSYLSSDTDIDSVELVYTEWETDLQLSIANTPNVKLGYDEYRYNIADISHNPYELLAFLTAVYDDFTYAEAESVLREVFSEQYILTYTESTETRGEGENTYQVKILTTTLTAQSFSNVVFYRMNAGQLERFNVYMVLKGNRQYLKSPFDFNWLPNVTSYYGYRVHPTTGVKDYHAGADIGVPTGTDIHAGHDGTVTFSGNNGNYGLVVVLEDGKGLVSKYAHCNTLTVSVGQTVKAGDVIAKVGNTGNSTGSHLHLEIIKDGQYLNPLYFAVTNDYGEGPTYSGNPGAAMGDGSYSALIAEAELHLGKPYVFGANGPNSFDCSSYVCWVLTKSGVKNMPRTTAYGIYQQCTPIPPSEAKPGDIIFFHSTYSTTSPISHVGIYVGNGKMIHAGSPIQYTSINSTYWQNHFYGFARVPN